jgi:hypothetical protein
LKGTLYQPTYTGYLFGLVFLVVGFNSFLITQKEKPKPESSQNSEISRLKSRLSAFLIIFLPLAIFAPMAIGIIDGSRPGPDYRYHLLIILLVVISVSLVLYKIFNRNNLILFIILLVVGFGTSSSLSTIQNQHNLDNDIWKFMDRVTSLKQVDAIVTYNPHANYAMPAYHSFAPSDFQADWGIGGKLFWNLKMRKYIFSKIECKGDKCLGFGYYGNVVQLAGLEHQKIVYVMSHVSEAPAKLSLDDFTITKNYRDYSAYISSYPKEN